jgi:hypothetical protein
MPNQDKLFVLWTSADREVALHMAFMYTLNAKMREWFGVVALVVWGPSAKLLAQDEELQYHIRKMIDVGVEVFACKACADTYGITAELTALGIDVKYMGQPMTEMLKCGWKTISV